MSLTKPKSTHRYRVCGTPSRLGCVTCKVRRVKCGEEKPFCKRCTSTGRKCDGYEPPPVLNGVNRRKTPKPMVNSTTEDNLEQQYLDHFSTYTAPTLTGNFSPDFWQSKVLQAAQVEPSIRHACIAIAAVHHDFEKKQNVVAESNCTLQAFAFRHYTMAISHLHSLMSTTQRLDMTLITCILFICFDCLLGNHASAVMHLKAGLKILEDIRTRNPHRETQVHEWEREFAPQLLSLGVQVATFIGPQFPSERKALWTSLQQVGLLVQPAALWSLDQARYALDTLCANVMSGRTLVRASILIENSPENVEPQGQALIPALVAWSNAVDRLIPELLASEPPVGKTSRASTLLKVHALVVSIVVGPPHDADLKFEKIIALCEFLIAANSSTYGVPIPTFSCDQGIIAPLFFTAWRAPSRAIRRQAINLLSKAPGREGLWDSTDAYRVAHDHLESENEQSDLLFHGSTAQVEAKIWFDIGARLKHRMAWSLDEGQLNMVEMQPSIFLDTCDTQWVTSPNHELALKTPDECYVTPAAMGLEENSTRPGPRPGGLSMKYETYSNE